MSVLRFLVPWQPSPTVVLVMLVFGILYARGERAVAVPWWRALLFWSGFVFIYLGLHTQLDYYAEREFFMHRLQHLLLHHLGPFLVALAWPGPVIRAGLPASWQERLVNPLLSAGPVRGLLNFVMQPLVAGLLFVGLIWFWLIPGVHFYAMLDVRLYRVMNWSMTIDGLWFWLLVLDARASPPARMQPGARVLLVSAVIPPQMVSGALITLSSTQLYPLYELCGRAFAGVTPANDQTLGGLILWIPSTMMSVIGAIIAMYHWYRSSGESDDAHGASTLVAGQTDGTGAKGGTRS